MLTVIENHTQQTDVLDEKQQLLFFEAVGHIISATRKQTLNPEPLFNQEDRKGRVTRRKLLLLLSFLRTSTTAAAAVVAAVVAAAAPGVQNDCIAALMGNCLKSWGEIINKGKNNAETLFSVQSAKQLVHIIRISQRIAK